MALVTTSFMMSVAFLLLGITGLLYWLATRNFNHWRKKGIPQIQPKPFVGNLQDMVLGKTSMGELLGNLYLQSVGKPYIGIFGFHRPILLVRDAEVIKSILVKDFNNFYNRSFSTCEESDPMFAKNLFGVNSPKWRHVRVKLTPTFTSGKMKVMFDLVDGCGKGMVKLFERELQNDSGVLEVREVFARYTTDVVASVGFGVEGNALKDPDSEFRRVLRMVVDFDFWKSLKASMAFFAPQLLTALRLRIWEAEITKFSRRVVWQTVEHRERTNLVRKDFLDLLMQIRAKGRVDGDAPQSRAEENGHAKTMEPADFKYEFDGDDFVAQAFVFMAAGYETSSSTTTFAVYELACNPDVQTRLREEIRSVLRANGGQFTYEAMQNMTYLHQVVQETLRLYPILPFLDRVCANEYQLPNSKATLEKGTTVMIPTFGIQRDPKIFEDPNAFKPERFADNGKNIPNFSVLPFGEGPRNCIGMRMGLMQVKVGLVHFLNRFEVAPSKQTSIPLVLDPKSFLLASKGGMHLTITKLADSVR